VPREGKFMLKKKNRPEKLLYYQKGEIGKSYLKHFTEAYLYLTVKSVRGGKIKMRGKFPNCKEAPFPKKFNRLKTLILQKVVMPEKIEISSEIVNKNLESQTQFAETRTSYLNTLAHRI